ncbi:hypothetical protein [Quadrisphaera sp. INWT6]|uniref:hypothetical protein n=1 Tax=Quadrisphaera sp. INWT6 TaxID=2596917 RepID=UPI001892622E|nr:hypothetical protein [Quadrisphaera sp. INWT6]MBF5080756.1 hypothetical protein [Quadrisphaera sp. INWT6]
MGAPVLRRPRALLVTTAVLAVVALSGCGRTVVAATGPSPADTSVPEIPVVEAFCVAEYYWLADAAELVSRADAVLRVTATGPSRDHEIRPDPLTDDQIPGIPATAITVRVTQVFKGDLAVGDEIEVGQGTCTDRPLPTGPGTDYVLALSEHEGHPYGQMNEDQAAWQVDATGGLHPVSPDNDLAVDGLEELAALAAAAAPSTQLP